MTNNNINYLKSENDGTDNKLVNKRNVYLIIFLIGIVSTNVLLSDYIRTDLIDFIWRADDATVIGVAYSFYKDNTLGPGFIDRNYVLYYKTDTLFEKFKSFSDPYYGKGPVYSLALGSFYKLLNTEPPFIYYHASIFNTILTSIFLILFFYLLLTKFNAQIAVISTTLLVFVPLFLIHGARVYPAGLVLVFSIASLFFLEKKNAHYVIFGILAALAWLTHPFGIFLGLSYVIFLLTQKEFKGFFIANAIGFSILAPWFYYNYYYFGDVGQGLFLPFTKNISELLSFIPRENTYYNPTPFGDYVVSHFPPLFTPFEVLHYVHIKGLILDFVMNYFAYFLFFSGFAFFDIKKLKKINLIIILSIALNISFIFFFIATLKSTFFEGIILFLFPILLVWFLWKKYKYYFNIPSKRLSTFIILFTFISILGLYGTSIMLNRAAPEIRQIVFPLIMITPLAVIGIEKIVNRFTEARKNRKIIFYIIIGLIFFPIIFQMLGGINYTAMYTKRTGNLQDDGLKEVNNFIINNTPENSVIASNEPGFTLINTGRNAIGLPENSVSISNLEKFVNHYKAPYLVSYDDTLGSVQSSDTLFQKLSVFPAYDYYYTKIYDDGKSKVLQQSDLLDADISEITQFAWKGLRLENEGKHAEAIDVFDKIVQHEKNLAELEQICFISRIGKMFEHSMILCDELLKKDEYNLIGLENLAVVYYRTGQINKTEDWSKVLPIKEIDDDKIVSEALDTVNQYRERMEQLRSNEKPNAYAIDQLIETAKGKAIFLTAIGKTNSAMHVYESILDINKFDIDVWKFKAEYHESRGEIATAINAYHFLSKLEPENESIILRIKELEKIQNQNLLQTN